MPTTSERDRPPFSASDEEFRAWHLRRVVEQAIEAQVPREYREARLDPLAPADSARAQVARWVDGFVSGESTNLIVSGPYGVAKTWLAWAAVAEAIRLCVLAPESCNPCLARQWAQLVEGDETAILLQRIREAYRDEESRDATYLGGLEARLRTFPVVVLDDLGHERHKQDRDSKSDWAESKLAEIISSRYADALPVIVTSNSFVPDLLGQRLADRLTQRSVFVVVNGRNFRKSMEQQ